MHAAFTDIRTRIAEPPTWYDQNGTPRYGRFAPEQCPNIYAREIALLEVACHLCDTRFLVEVHWSPGDPPESRLSMGLLDTPKRWPGLHYGDPPFHTCSGDCMLSRDLRVLEFWKRGSGPQALTWHRWPEHEIPLEPPISPPSPGTVRLLPPRARPS